MSRKCIAIITDNAFLSQVLDKYVKAHLGEDTDRYYMTYGESRLSQELMKAADLIILGLFRCYGLRVRAEGVMVARRLAQYQKPLLIISGLVRGDKLTCRTYWDLASSDLLADRLAELLAAPTTDLAGELLQLEQYFSAYCFAPAVGHHSL